MTVDSTIQMVFSNVAMYTSSYMDINNTDGYTVPQNTTFTEDEYNQETYNVPQEALVVAGIVIIPVIVIALVGNLLTILSFIRDKQLHQSINIYILNLAIADFFIGLISMPIYLIYTLNKNVWIFGYHVCKAYLLSDVVFTSVGLEVMILISYDRLMLLRHWSRNYKEQTRKKAYIRSGIAWIIAIVAFGPATLFWDIWIGVDSVTPNDCKEQYADNTIYTAILSFLAFPFPFIILSIYNILIMHQIRKVLTTSEKLSNLSTLVNSQESSPTVSVSDIRKWTAVSQHGGNSLRTKEQFHTRNGRKAAKALAMLTIVFVLTWAPYAVAMVLQSFCDTCVSRPVSETFIWILWFKSAINPFLYAFNCNRFRSNFKFFLCLNKKRPNSGNSRT